MSELDRELARQQAEMRGAQSRHGETEDFGSMLEHISSDTAGTPPAELLSDGDVRVCQDFLRKASELGFPNATHIDMKVKRSGGPVWTRDPRIFPNTRYALTKAIVLRTEWQGIGYPIGYIRPKDSSGTGARLMLCNDGRLRCARYGLINRSYGDGYGTLPKGVRATIVMSEPITGYNDTRNTHEFVERPLARVLASYLTN